MFPISVIVGVFRLNEEQSARLRVLLSMVIYGTIGVFVRHIPLPASVIAMMRGAIGTPFLLLVLLLSRGRLNWPEIRRNLPRLILTGVVLGVNWIALFTAYNYTKVSTAVLFYYMAPIILVAASPFVFGERMTVRKVLCILAALLGMVFVSGMADEGLPRAGDLKGILLALLAAFFYAFVVIQNKKLHGLGAYDRTILQLGVSALVLLPYNLLTRQLGGLTLTPKILLMLLVIGVVHTGLAYYLYFGSVEHLKSQTLAILSYVDPVVALILSALILREKLSALDLLGAALILGAALVSELPERKKQDSKGA